MTTTDNDDLTRAHIVLYLITGVYVFLVLPFAILTLTFAEAIILGGILGGLWLTWITLNAKRYNP